jgi:4-hydroxybenzoate polyprenyltransferase
VVATSAAGYAAGSREAVDWGGMAWTCLGTLLASSSANALNQVYERSNDARMKRTMNRPLPAGRMSRPHALAFAALAGAGGVWLLAEKVSRHTRPLAALAVLACTPALLLLPAWAGLSPTPGPSPSTQRRPTQPPRPWVLPTSGCTPPCTPP